MLTFSKNQRDLKNTVNIFENLQKQLPNNKYFFKILSLGPQHGKNYFWSDQEILELK